MARPNRDGVSPATIVIMVILLMAVFVALWFLYFGTYYSQASDKGIGAIDHAQSLDPSGHPAARPKGASCLRLEQSVRLLFQNSFNPSHSGGGGFLFHNFEMTEITGICRMRAAANFL